MGDTILWKGHITNYQGNTYQTAQGGEIITGTSYPEPTMKETNLAGFIGATSDIEKAELYHFSAEVKSVDDTYYGNLTLTDGTNDLTVYGSTATASALAWSTSTGVYVFTNPHDFGSDTKTKDIAAGDIIEVKMIRYLHNSVVQAQGIIVDVSTPSVDHYSVTGTATAIVGGSWDLSGLTLHAWYNAGETSEKALVKGTDYSLTTSTAVGSVGTKDVTVTDSLGLISGSWVVSGTVSAEPSEESEVFDFTDSGLWDGTETDEHDDAIYKRTVDLITMSWESNNQSNKAGANWNPGRVYQNHIVTITALTGTGAVTSIRSVTFHTVKNGSNSTTGGTNNATKTVLLPSSNPGTIASAVDGQDVTYTITGTVTSFKLQTSAQTRWSTVEVTYDKDQSVVALNSISATCGPILVSQKATPIITFNPQNASNKNVTLEIVEGTSNLAEISADGKTVIAKSNGTARLKITPEDTNASAITIDVTINSLPDIYGVTLGNKYAITGGDYELTGIDESTATKFGISTAFEDNPSNSFPVKVVNGLYAHTVALQVEINSSTVYLSHDSAANANSLDYSSTINRESSWIFKNNNGDLQIENVEATDRYLCMMADGSRFACYQVINDKTMPTFVEIVEQKTDKEHVQDFVDLYMHLDDYNSELGYCKDGEHSYYLTAKAGYNSLIRGNSDREYLWQNDSDFAAAKARYEAWAVANNDAAPYDGNDTVVTPIRASRILLGGEDATNNTFAIAVVIAVMSVTVVGGYFFLRKKKTK